MKFSILLVFSLFFSSYVAFCQVGSEAKAYGVLDSLNKKINNYPSYTLELVTTLYAGNKSTKVLEQTKSTIIKENKKCKVSDETGLKLMDNNLMTFVDFQKSSIIIKPLIKTDAKSTSESNSFFNLVGLDTLIKNAADELEKSGALDNDSEIETISFLNNGNAVNGIYGIELKGEHEEIEKINIYYNSQFWVTKIVMYCAFEEEFEGKNIKPRIEFNYNYKSFLADKSLNTFSNKNIVTKKGNKWIGVGKYKNYNVVYIN